MVRDGLFQFILSLTISLPSCPKCKCRCNARYSSSHTENKREKSSNCREMNPGISGLVGKAMLTIADLQVHRDGGKCTPICLSHSDPFSVFFVVQCILNCIENVHLIELRRYGKEEAGQESGG